MANLNRLQAQQAIHLGLYDPADYRGVYDLWLTAFGDVQQARQARPRALNAYVDRHIQQHKR